MLNKPMEARQQHIADLARHILPFMEEHEQKERFQKISYHLLLLLLTAVLAWSGAQYLRPISSTEEKSLRMLIEYSAFQRQLPVTVATQNLLDHLQLKRLDEIRSYQWKEAIARVTENLD